MNIFGLLLSRRRYFISSALLFFVRQTADKNCIMWLRAEWQLIGHQESFQTDLEDNRELWLIAFVAETFVLLQFDQQRVISPAVFHREIERGGWWWPAVTDLLTDNRFINRKWTGIESRPLLSSWLCLEPSLSVSRWGSPQFITALTSLHIYWMPSGGELLNRCTSSWRTMSTMTEWTRRRWLLPTGSSFTIRFA